MLGLGMVWDEFARKHTRRITIGAILGMRNASVINKYNRYPPTLRSSTVAPQRIAARLQCTNRARRTDYGDWTNRTTVHMCVTFWNNQGICTTFHLSSIIYHAPKSLNVCVPDVADKRRGPESRWCIYSTTTRKPACSSCPKTWLTLICWSFGMRRIHRVRGWDMMMIVFHRSKYHVWLTGAAPLFTTV